MCLALKDLKEIKTNQSKKQTKRFIIILHEYRFISDLYRYSQNKVGNGLLYELKEEHLNYQFLTNRMVIM